MADLRIINIKIQQRGVIRRRLNQVNKKPNYLAYISTYIQPPGCKPKLSPPLLDHNQPLHIFLSGPQLVAESLFLPHSHTCLQRMFPFSPTQ